MKKCILIITIIIILCLTGCSTDIKDNTYQPQEQPHLYWKDIDVLVTDIDRRRWFAGTHWYEVKITVESEEYGLIENFTIKGSGAFGCPHEWDYEEGQIVQAELYSWVMDSTGEVVRRDINKIY
jgi:hypothetical protein